MQNNDMPELLPCPFCVSRIVAIIRSAVKMDCSDAPLEDTAKVVCNGCGTQTRVFNDDTHSAEQNAINAWNTRADLVQPEEYIQALNEIYAGLHSLSFAASVAYKRRESSLGNALSNIYAQIDGALIKLTKMLTAGGCNGDPSRNGCEHCEPEHGCKPQPATDELAQVTADIVNGMKPCDPDIMEIINQNSEDLYVKSPQPAFDVAKVREALEWCQCAMRIKVLPETRISKDGGATKKSAQDIYDLSEQALAELDNAGLPHIEGLAEALKKANHPGHRINLLIHQDDVEILSKLKQASAEYLKRMKPEAGE